MSYGQPGLGGFAPVPPTPRPSGAGGGGLPGLAVLMIVQLALQLGILIYEVDHLGAKYLQYAFGFGGEYHFAACGPFGPSDTMQCVALIVMIIAAFSGRRWVRGAVTVLLLINSYALGSELINIITQDNGWDSLTKPTTPMLWLTLDLIAQAVVGLVVALVVLATKSSGDRPAQPGYTPPFGGPQPAAAGHPVLPAARHPRRLPAPAGPAPGRPAVALRLPGSLTRGQTSRSSRKARALAQVRSAASSS
ncbi:hypothetical protein ACFYNO_02485 [Kitasatospora sp. NPDC006697]|uniref:hypothetical protein n=1 Tax=Kitasatospora sp. NPDC006697 TaxID=3364020 RepID=UPI00369E319B